MGIVSTSLPVGRRLGWFALALLLAAMLAGAAAAAAAATTLRSPSWTRTLPHVAGAGDDLRGVAMDAHGATLCTGRAYRSMPGNAQLAVARFAASGRRSWLKYWADSDPTSSNEPCALALDRAGDAYVAASIQRPATGQDVVLLKYSPRGRLVWSRRFASRGAVDDYAYAATVAGDGSVYFTGTSRVIGGDHAVFVAKYTAAGRRVWVARLTSGGPREFLSALAADGAGSVYGCGAVDTAGSGRDALMVRVSSSGRFSWVRTWAGSAGVDDQLADLVVRDGLVWASGVADSGVAGSDGLLLRYTCGRGAARGRLVWDDGAGGHNDFGSITMDAAGRCYVASGGTIPAAGAPGLFTLRLSSALAVAWTRTVIADSEVEDVQVEATGRSRVTASGIADPPTSISSVVAQYGSGGGLRWTSVLPGTPAYIGQFLAASPDGSVSLAGMQSDFLESTSVLAHWSP